MNILRRAARANIESMRDMFSKSGNIKNGDEMRTNCARDAQTRCARCPNEIREMPKRHARDVFLRRRDVFRAGEMKNVCRQRRHATCEMQLLGTIWLGYMQNRFFFRFFMYFLDSAT